MAVQCPWVAGARLFPALETRPINNGKSVQALEFFLTRSLMSNPGLGHSHTHDVDAEQGNHVASLVTETHTHPHAHDITAISVTKCSNSSPSESSPVVTDDVLSLECMSAWQVLTTYPAAEHFSFFNWGDGGLAYIKPAACLRNTLLLVKREAGILHYGNLFGVVIC